MCDQTQSWIIMKRLLCTESGHLAQKQKEYLIMYQDLVKWRQSSVITNEAVELETMAVES